MQEGQPAALAGLEERLGLGAEEGLQQLRKVRALLGDLPTYSVSTASVWAALDFLLGSSESAARLTAQPLEEYREIGSWLDQEYLDLKTLESIEVLKPNEPTSVMNFKITTAKGLYVLSVQTKDLSAGGSVWAHVRLPEFQAAVGRLEEIVTGEVFPWDPPYHYQGSYLRGETDRFGNPGGQERWGVKPGDQKGDYQFFRVAPGDNGLEQIGWNDLLAPAIPSAAAPFLVQRPTETQLHQMIKDPELGVAADIVTGQPFSGSGTLLLVTFPNGNSGIALRDTAASKPYELSDLRVVSRLNGKQRGVEYGVKASGPAASFNGIVLDSMRTIREWNSWDEGRTRAGRYEEFGNLVRRLPRKVLADLRRDGIPLVELTRRVSPRIFYRRTLRDQRLYVFRLTLGGHLYLVEMIFPPSVHVKWTPQGKIDIQSSTSRRPLRWKMVVTTDFPALTPLPLERLVRPEVIEQSRHSQPLREELEDLRFLAFEEFFAAGSHRFLQFFGRDTLIWLRLFGPLLTPEAHEVALQSVLDRVSPQGQVPSVEELDDQVAFELIEEFTSAVRQMGESGGTERFSQAARNLADFSRGQIPSQVLKYGVPDVDMMLQQAVADYLARSDVSPSHKAEFLGHSGKEGPNLSAILKNADWVMNTASSYLLSQGKPKPWPQGLVGVPKEGDFGNWRDVGYGLGYGIYPSDVNAVLIPGAVRATRSVLQATAQFMVGDGAKMESILGTGEYPALKRLVDQLGPAIFEDFDEAWEGVRRRFSFSLTPEEIRSRLAQYLQQVSPKERDWLLAQPLGSQVQIGHFMESGGPVPAVLGPSMDYFPVSLDRAGQPVPVVASDGILDLLDPNLPEWRLIQILTPLLLPFPVGLWTPAGFLVASPALSNQERLWREISRTAYGGSVIYGWQMEYFKQGLYRQLIRADLEGDAQLAGLLYSAFEAVYQATPAQMTGQELWSWEVDDKGFHPVGFGQLPGHNDESNPVQLWSISSSELLRPQVQAAAAQRGLSLLQGGPMLDSLAKLRQRYPAPAQTGLEEKPRIASLSLSLPPGGGGVNIVLANQVALFQAGGYPLTMVGGQVIAMPPEMKASPPEDNVYGRAGMRLHIVPEMDVNDQLQREIREGRLDLPSFNQRVERVQQKIEEAIADAKVILIHQYMTMPTNILVVEAMGRLALKYQGEKRFIAWVHNVLPGKEQVWPLTSVTSMHPQMEYVAVSPQLRDQTLDLFGMRKWPWMIGVIKNSISILNFFDINPNVLKTYFDNRLYDAEYLLFYPARLTETKEIAGAIGAVKRARDRGHDVRLVVSTTAYEGKIPQEAQAYYRHLLEFRDRLGLTEREIIIYLHDPAPDDLKSQKEIRDWFFLSDALLFTSQVETGGIPIKEAKMARRAVFHADYDVLNSETNGYPHVTRFPLRQHWESEEGYGWMVGEHVANFIESPPGRIGVSLGRAQKHEVKQSLEGLLNQLSGWANLPPPGKRAIRAGTRNFASTGRLTEQAISDAKDAGYRAFEINFEGFEPSFIDADGISKIREAAAGLRLTLRLTDLPSVPAERVEQLLRDAALFAMETGAQQISIPAEGLDPGRAEKIVKAAEWAKQEAGSRQKPIPDILFFVENAWRQSRGEWNTIAPEVLRSSFAEKPVGLSLWMDAFRTWELDGATYYVDTARLKLGTVYLGSDFFESADSSLLERARALLVEMHRRHWEGDVIGQTIPSVPVRALGGPEQERERDKMKEAFLNRVIAEAYLPQETSASLRNGGELVGTPSMEVRRVEAGLEEVQSARVMVAGLQQLLPGVEEAASLAQPLALLFDPSLVPADSDEAKQVELIELAGNLRKAMSWPEEVPLELGLANERTLWEREGFRVIELRRGPGMPDGALPPAALPVVVAQALAAFQNLFWVDVAAYGSLRNVTLPEILSTLTDLFA
ncbi:MAG: hypothetical protein Q7J69_07030 [Candidatus Omnitrophota bacterium]|nr:hypothetical protein [Candidatus Omnitrophota bacterium]